MEKITADICVDCGSAQGTPGCIQCFDAGRYVRSIHDDGRPHALDIKDRDFCADCGCTITQSETHYDGQYNPICPECFEDLYGWHHRQHAAEQEAVSNYSED